MNTGRLFAAITALAAMAHAEPPADAPVVAVDGGSVAGERQADRVAFRAVPFAAPPVGPLRWRPPAPVTPWQGIRDARRSAPACPQLDDGWNKADADRSAEDCLYLELATPSLAPAKPLPVMVWIHGGSNKAGGGSGTIASSLVRHGIVLVSIQYRLGPLGFMAHRALTAEAPYRASGNYGLMDQQAALRWVRRNIARFGGDPGNVTIFGGSAGAEDVGLQQLSPRAAGLFDKAIEQSGTPGFGWRPRDLRASEAIGEEIAALAGAPHADAARLRAVPASALLAAARRIRTPTGLPEAGTVWLQTTIDGHVVAEPPAATLARGGGARVPLLIGSNATELPFYPSARAARAAIRRAFGMAHRAQAMRAYPLDRADGRDAAATDIVFTCPAALVASARQRTGVPVWRYLFGYAPPGAPPARHGSELALVLGTAGDDPAAAPPLQAYWANFARTGDPNGEGLPRWPRYGTARRSVLLAGPTPVAGRDPQSVPCRWARYP